MNTPPENTVPENIPPENTAPESGDRERGLVEAFVHLADTLVTDFDVIELLHQLSTECVRLLPVDAAGLLLSDQRGALQVVSCSSERTHLLELFQVQTDEGPCRDCFHSSHPISVHDLGEATSWPRFTPRAVQAGFRSVYALPLRLRADTIGTLNLFGVQPDTLSANDLGVGQALADVATIGILSERAIRRHEIIAEQLEGALHSRIVIEQAKAMIAERGHLDFEEAFQLLRRYARAHNQHLGELARAVVERRTALDDLI